MGGAKPGRCSSTEAMIPMLTRPNDPGHPHSCAIAMLQIILQILIEELEVSLSAVHPNDATVREKEQGSGM